MVGLNLLNLIWWGIGRFFGWDDTVSFVWLWNWSFFWGLVHVDTVHFIADKTIRGKEQFIDE